VDKAFTDAIDANVRDQQDHCDEDNGGAPGVLIPAG
jgi:hypothetical protein